ncbi:dual oxidase maturation factor 2 isoform X2 [Cuculus canorus]|uniref:dual oxidase maturation factor 2 isoform X2 n=1 Tax=Cuculus canorus TaxID=55661 RepID=UPI0023AB08E7|nr:dual oxidase maturation factor 2 isoform X2 [Cuculus canorus]
MTLFNSVYPFYPQQSKAFVFNVATIIVIVVFLTFACTFLLIIPGIRGRARLYWTLRVLLSLFMGVVIVRNPVNQVNETIDYNEYFSWSFDANYDHSYSEGLERGLPSPILYVAEKFTTQSPCDVHRQYRISGHYASATLWVAFCTWLISNMLFSMPVLVYGGYMLLVTGAFMIFSLLSFFSVRNTLVCPIQFGTTILHTNYGGSFWLTLAIGLLCFTAGIAVVALHYFNLELLKTFFDLHDNKVEEHQEMTEVYVNPHVMNKGLSAPLPSKLNLNSV